MTGSTDRIVVGYSGSLATTVAISWLAEHRGVDVIAVTLDIGQEGELTDVRERALGAGALRAHVLDVRDEFANEYILPALQAGGSGPGGVPLVTALSRPILAKKLIDIARMEGATAIAHGCFPYSDDEARLESLIKALDPRMTVIAPLRDSPMTPDEQAAYARGHNIFVPADASGGRTDVNLWGRSTELTTGRSTDDIYVLTRSPEDCPDEPAWLEVEFDRGIPVRANGIEMALAELVESIETIAGAHGVGRFDAADASAGDAAWVHEAPAAVVLQTAHAALEESALPPDLCLLKDVLGRGYGRLIDEGGWFTPMREAVDAFVASAERRVTGTVRVELVKGRCRAVGCRVPVPAEPAHDPEPIERLRGH